MAVKSAELSILKAVNKYDCLTIEQIQRILARRDYAEMTRKLKEMTREHLLERKRLPPIRTTGNYTWLHHLGEEGKEALREDPVYDVAIPRFDMGADPHWVSIHYWHTVFVNDFFINANEWAGKNDNVTIANMRHETEIKRTKDYFPAQVVLPDGTPAGVIPDGWLDVRRGTRKRDCFVVELETGTQKPATIKKKIRSLVAFANGPYEDIFGTDNLTYLYIALEGEKHRANIVTAIEQVLQEYEREDESGLFLVTGISPGDSRLFVEPTWYRPTDTTSHMLLE